WNLPLEMCASGRTPYDGPSLCPVCREHVRHRTSAHHDPCVYGYVGEVEDDARSAEADAEEVGYARRLKSEAGRVCNGSSNHQAQCDRCPGVVLGERRAYRKRERHQYQRTQEGYGKRHAVERGAAGKERIVEEEGQEERTTHLDVAVREQYERNGLAREVHCHHGE